MRDFTNAFINQNGSRGYSVLTGPFNLCVPYLSEVAVNFFLDVLDVLERHEIKFVVFAGAQVGFHRNGKLPRWSDDLDLLVFEDQINKVTTAAKELETLGYFIKRPQPPYSAGGIQIFNQPYVYHTEGEQIPPTQIKYRSDVNITLPFFQVDIFFSKFDGKNLINLANWGHYHNLKIPISWIYPLRKVKLIGRELNFFNCSEAFVERHYGDVHNNVVISTHEQGYKNISIKDCDAAEFCTFYENFIETIIQEDPLYHLKKEVKLLRNFESDKIVVSKQSLEDILIEVLKYKPRCIEFQDDSRYWASDISLINHKIKIRMDLTNQCDPVILAINRYIKSAS